MNNCKVGASAVSVSSAGCKMNGKFIVLLFIIGLTCVPTESATVELRVPSVQPFTNIVTRITNTTFGIVRGGINIFSRTVDRIIDTFGRVEDRLRELLEEFRRQIVRGIPELSIPILDPLHIDKIDFDVVHEAAGLKGKAEDITVKHISKFIIDNERFTDLGNLNFQLDLNLTFPYLRIDGHYNLDGIIGETFVVFGDGKFWLNLHDFKLGISAIITFEHLRLKLTALDLDIKLRKLENDFENLMGDKEIGELFNKAISRMAPEALSLLWPDIKEPVEAEVLKYINQILENTTVASVARRLFNIR